MCRANGSPTCARSPGPSGRPGSNRADGTLSSPRPVSDPTPTATTPNARQPLQEHTPPASRTPPIHVRSNEGRGRIPHALRKAQAAPRDHESGSSRRVPRTRRGCKPIRYRSGYRHSRGIRVVHAGSTTINSIPRRRHCRYSAAITWRERKVDFIAAPPQPPAQLAGARTGGHTAAHTGSSAHPSCHQPGRRPPRAPRSP